MKKYIKAKDYLVPPVAPMQQTPTTSASPKCIAGLSSAPKDIRLLVVGAQNSPQCRPERDREPRQEPAGPRSAAIQPAIRVRNGAAPRARSDEAQGRRSRSASVKRILLRHRSPAPRRYTLRHAYATRAAASRHGAGSFHVSAWFRCHRSSPVSRPRPPASSISEARAPPCSTGSMRAGAAARCCCGSRTPTASAPPTPRSPPSSTA